jgi:hypothetical protein
MTFFSRIFLFGSGIVSGAYLDQKYSLPNVEQKFTEYCNWIKTFEPPKKDN